MDALASGRTHERVVVQGCHDRRAVLRSQRWQIEGEVQEVVNVDHVGLNGPHHVRDSIADEWGAVRLGKRGALPVVDDLDDLQIVKHPPCDMAVAPPGIVFGAQNADVVSRCELPTETKRVDFRSGAMPRQEIVNRVKESHFVAWTARRSRSSAERIAVSSISRSICCRCRDTITERHSDAMNTVATSTTSRTAGGSATPSHCAVVRSMSCRIDTTRSARAAKIQRNEYSSVSLRRRTSSRTTTSNRTLAARSSS